MNEWLEQRRQSARHVSEKISFPESKEWLFENGRLVHTTGGFFSVEGIRCRASHLGLNDLQQPIINQPEVGILGFLVYRHEVGFDWLVQAKNEPGNIGGVQLAPAVQATFSNYTRLHGGEATHYLQHFKEEGAFLSDSLQSEQGTRFLKKFNRNMISEVHTRLDAETNNFCWFSSGEIKNALLEDYALNTDARSVLTTGPWSLLAERHGLFKGDKARKLFGDGLAGSYALGVRSGLLSDIQKSIQVLRDEVALSYELTALGELKGWAVSDNGVEPLDSGHDLLVEQYKVNSPDREKPKWDQPLVRSINVDDVVLLCQMRNGSLRFLLRPAIEGGLTGGVELGPSFKKECKALFPKWLCDLIDETEGHTVIQLEQSDEGGRFMESRARYRIVELPEDVDVPCDRHNFWVSLSELEQLCRTPKLMTNEARSVVSVCLGLA